MNISLTQIDCLYKSEGFFANATDGSKSDFRTEFQVSKDEQYLIIHFSCRDNLYTFQNSMKKHNEPLYNQEVFEVFIAKGEEDPKEYLEIEINPNNAIWIGKIKNESLGNEPHELLEMISPIGSGIKHGVEVIDEAWQGFLYLPWELIGKSAHYRLNFYRIRLKVKQNEQEWVCSEDSCDFVCWNSTMSGEIPAFHKPKKFGFLEIKTS